MSHFGRSGPPDIRDTYSLLVLNISFRTSADDLFPLFDRHGKVVDVFIPRDRRTGDSRGFAFVRYKHIEEAEKAIERLHGRVVDGREIMVQFAKYGPNAESIDRGRISHSQDRSPRRSRHRDNYYRRGSRSRSRSYSRSPSRRSFGGSRRDRHRDRGSYHRSRSRSLNRSLSRSRSPVRKTTRSRSQSFDEDRPRHRSKDRKTSVLAKRDSSSPRDRSPVLHGSLSPAKPKVVSPVQEGMSRGGRTKQQSRSMSHSHSRELSSRSRSRSPNSDD
ncbi:hypothetical protein KP509_15G003400 [Ceratopteris richardii]|uniref:RRM domain-containing protein n=1 Tax=Ceratopteris richardii TaxID=49495 RepID=A0A8T2T595_CERRI|nr:hypothetical protein KP509_15G003400 [Ceratopteris richardii]KAH7403981.1 hypothetical protein KP509_15G003400 [Ceratopteris richardii]